MTSTGKTVAISAEVVEMVGSLISASSNWSSQPLSEISDSDNLSI